MNLIENAIKYGNEGGNVWITYEKMETQYQLCVSDDGIGISREDLPKIFERFYRADKAGDRSGSGFGSWTFHCEMDHRTSRRGDLCGKQPGKRNKNNREPVLTCSEESGIPFRQRILKYYREYKN